MGSALISRLASACVRPREGRLWGVVNVHGIVYIVGLVGIVVMLDAFFRLGNINRGWVPLDGVTRRRGKAFLVVAAWRCAIASCSLGRGWREDALSNVRGARTALARGKHVRRNWRAWERACGYPLCMPSPPTSDGSSSKACRFEMLECTRDVGGVREGLQLLIINMYTVTPPTKLTMLCAQLSYSAK